MAITETPCARIVVQVAPRAHVNVESSFFSVDGSPGTSVAREGWDALAAWRDFRMGERGDLWHRAIIDPTLVRIVGPVRGRRVLDLGCGNGYLTRRWAREGAQTVVGVDRSRRTLELARRREKVRRTGARFLERDAAHLGDLADASFDLVVANMSLQDMPDGEGAIREAARLLDAGGRLVFSLSHPCFDLDERSGWVVERVREPDGTWHNVVWRKVRAYRDEREVRVPWKISERETGWTTGYHRTLSTLSRWLRTAGLAITRLEEPAPLAEAVRDSPQGRFLAEIPLHLVVEARPIDALRPLKGPPRTRRSASRRSGGRSWTGDRRSGSRGRTRGIGSRRRGSRTRS